MNRPDADHVPLRVALLTWAYPPEKSGLSRAAAEIAQALAGAGAQVCVFSFDRAGRMQDGPVSVIGCAPRARSPVAWARRIAAVGHLAGPFAFRRAVLAEHRVQPFDVIEATNWYAPAALLTLAGPVPVVTRNSTPNATSIVFEPGLRARIDRRAAIAIERASARRSSALISNTRPHGEKIATLYGVPPPGPGHAVVGLSLPPAIVAAGRAAAYPDGAPVELLFVGRDEPRKGFDAVADALALLTAEAASEALPDFRLTVVGIDIATFAAWPAAVRARVRSHHRVCEATLHALLAAAHVVVAPSRYESFGLVYQEAMMFGRPIAACAEDPSARLFIGETGAGLLAEACTGAALAAVLRPLIADAGLRQTVAARSRAAGGRFTRESLAAETLAVYRSAIASKGRSSRSSSSMRAASGDIAP